MRADSNESGFLRNAWYCAGFASEIGENQLRAITVLGQPLVLFRDPHGVAVALANRCPHRLAPLSRGRLQNGVLECGYHGLRFDGTGKCVHNPHGATPAAARVRAFPTLERYSAVWVWMGEPDKSDPALLADFSATQQRPGWSRMEGYLHVKANYLLVSDNLLDLSHVRFLHPFLSTDGPSPSGFRPNFKVEQHGNTVSAVNELNSTRTPPMYRLLWERGDAPDVCDLRANVRWDPPSVMLLDTGATRVDAPREAGTSQMQAHWLTPETELTTHYFWAVCCDRYLNDPTAAERVRAGIDGAFRLEDGPMIEAVQQNMGTASLWDAQPVLLSMDGAPVRARRIIEKLVAAECAATGTADGR